MERRKMSTGSYGFWFEGDMIATADREPSVDYPSTPWLLRSPGREARRFRTLRDAEAFLRL